METPQMKMFAFECDLDGRPVIIDVAAKSRKAAARKLFSIGRANFVGQIKSASSDSSVTSPRASIVLVAA